MKSIIFKLFVAIFLFFIISCQHEPLKEEAIACPACVLIPNVGPCNAAMPRFYFDSEEQKCKEFIWGGCAGVVPFENLADCEACACN